MAKRRVYKGFSKITNAKPMRLKIARAVEAECRLKLLPSVSITHEALGRRTRTGEAER